MQNCHRLWCRSPSPYVFLVRTVDLTPPVFVGATPRVQDIAATSFELVVQMNKAGLVFYVVLLQVRCCVDAALSAASLAGDSGLAGVRFAAATVGMAAAAAADRCQM